MRSQNNPANRGQPSRVAAVNDPLTAAHQMGGGAAQTSEQSPGENLIRSGYGATGGVVAEPKKENPRF